MGVRKFRSVAEMPGPPRLPPLEPENLRIALRLSALACAFRPARRRPGVRRFRSLDEALASRAAEAERGAKAG